MQKLTIKERLQCSHSNEGTEEEREERLSRQREFINSFKLHSGALLAPQACPTMLLTSV